MAAVSPAPEPHYLRRCPSCGQTHEPEVLRCSCGALLAGVDLERAAPPVLVDLPGTAAPAPPAGPEEDAVPADESTTLACPYPDCGQLNPASASACLYCNRPLTVQPQAGASSAQTSLNILPTALRQRYEQVRSLPAEGAEADIVLVREPGAPLLYAAKIYRQGIRPSEAVRQRLLQIGLEHRVRIHAAGISDGRAYEVMEYCELGSLRQHLPHTPLPAPQINDIVRELARALAAVHAVGLVHRDLKPENVLLRSRQPLDLVLTDFNTASAMQATRRFTSMARTLMYAAPETLSGVIDAKADYWSLGIMVLEMAAGRHPYAGLSDAVILHHLATHDLELAGVTDARLHLLLQGLLVRDPARRWGAAELQRWLAGDAGLQAPTRALPAGPGGAFPRPYLVQDRRCTSPEQLAIAFASHWSAGRTDLVSESLLEWFTHVHPDQNLVRLLLHLRYERKLSPDQQLLHFILELAPGIVPVWKGRSVELPALLASANEALRGDAAAIAWLDEIHRERVLAVYAGAGNAQAGELAQRWDDMASGFDTAWQELEAQVQAAEEAPPRLQFFDYHARLRRPALASLHPRLLAAAYDPRWLQALRSRVAHELALLRTDDSALAAQLVPDAMDAPQLLACEAMLEHLRTAVARRAEQAQHRRAQHEEEARHLRQRLRACLELLSAEATTCSHWFAPPQVLHQQVDEFFDLLVQVRTLEGASPESNAVRRLGLRAEPLVLRMRGQLDQIVHRREANRGWISPQVGRGLLFVGLALVWFSRLRLLPPLILLGAAVLAWRWGPVFGSVRRLRALGRALQGTSKNSSPLIES